MIATAGIYLVGIVLCALAGTAAGGLLDPRGRWVGAATLPLGFAVLVALLYPVGLAAGSTIAAPVVLALVLAGLLGAVLLRLRGPRLPWRGALVPDAAGAVALGLGALAGLLLLAATLDVGFPTTIAVTNNDGWGYATLVDFLQHDTLPGHVTPDIAHPLTFVPWTTDRLHFGVGFEHVAAMIATLLGRQGFEVVNATAAVALASAVGGWTWLAGALRRDLRAGPAALVALAVASPALAIPFAENYTTQFASLCLWPFALAAVVRLAAAPGWRALVLAGIGCGAVVGVYPAAAPFLVLPVVGAALLAPDAPWWAEGRLRRLAGGGLARRIGRAGVTLAAVAVAMAVLTPIGTTGFLRNLTTIEGLPVNAGAAFYSLDGYAAIFLGAAPVFSLVPGTPVPWAAAAALILLIAAFALGLLPPRRRDDMDRWRIVAFALGVLLPTAAIAIRYGVREELPYQVYKGLISGGAVLAGLAIIGLLPREGTSPWGPRLLALGLVAAVWIPVTGQELQSTVNAGPGFRAADVQMGRALDRLPEGSTVLAEGAAPDERSFQFRMMAAYFGDDPPHHTAIGLGSTGSYLTGGGGAEWRPARPWTHVLTNRPQPVATRRPTVWTNGAYNLAAAPELDVTPFGAAWYPPEQDADGVFEWTSGPMEVVAMNRGARARPAQLRMTVASQGRPRTLHLSVNGAPPVDVPLPADRETPVALDLDLPAGSAVPVAVAADPPGRSARAVGDPRVLMVRVEDLRVVPRG